MLHIPSDNHSSRIHSETGADTKNKPAALSRQTLTLRWIAQATNDVGKLGLLDFIARFFLDFSGKGEVRFRSFDFGTGRWIFEGISTCVQ